MDPVAETIQIQRQREEARADRPHRGGGALGRRPEIGGVPAKGTPPIRSGAAQPHGWLVVVSSAGTSMVP